MVAIGKARVETVEKRLRGHRAPCWHYKQSKVACKYVYTFFFRNIYIIAGQVRGSDLSRPDPPLAVFVLTLAMWP